MKKKNFKISKRVHNLNTPFLLLLLLICGNGEVEGEHWELSNFMSCWLPWYCIKPKPQKVSEAVTQLCFWKLLYKIRVHKLIFMEKIYNTFGKQTALLAVSTKKKNRGITPKKGIPTCINFFLFVCFIFFFSILIREFYMDAHFTIILTIYIHLFYSAIFVHHLISLIHIWFILPLFLFNYLCPFHHHFKVFFPSLSILKYFSLPYPFFQLFPILSLSHSHFFKLLFFFHLKK